MNTTKKLLPNLLTVLRILMIPIIVTSLYFANDHEFYYIVAAIAFSVASLTDFIDGYLARIWQAQSNLGKFLDPIADKLIISTIIIMLVHIGKIHGLNIFPSLTIICREILISGIREFMGSMKIEIPVTYLAKIKTTLQMLAVMLLLLSGCSIFIPIYLHNFGELMLWISAILTLYSGYKYLKIPMQYFSHEVKHKID